MTPEGKVKKEVREFLKKENIWYYQPVQNGMGQVGIPDFICCRKGTFIGIETKAPGKKNQTTPNQERVMKEIRDHGGFTLVADSVLDVHLFFKEWK